MTPQGFSEMVQVWLLSRWGMVGGSPGSPLGWEAARELNSPALCRWNGKNVTIITFL